MPVTLSAPQGASIGSQLWSVDAARQQISFSADADSPQLLRLAQDDEAVAVAYLDHVKLQFDVDELVLVRAAASCALRARLPALLYRFQRRASYRVRNFDRRTPKALLRHPSMPDMRIGLRIVDLSVGGCALLRPDDIPPLQPGTQLAGVRIELDADLAFDATLRLQHVSDDRPRPRPAPGLRVHRPGRAGAARLAALHRPGTAASPPAGAALTPVALHPAASRWSSCAWCWR